MPTNTSGNLSPLLPTSISLNDSRVVCRGCDSDSVKNCYIEMAKVTKGHNYTGEIIDIQYSKRDIIASYYNATYHCAVISLYND